MENIESPLPPSGPVRKNLLFGLLMAALVIGSFFVGQNTRNSRPESLRLTGEVAVSGLGQDAPVRVGEVDFADFWRVWQTVKDRHVSGSVTDSQLFYGALDGLVSSLEDPYSIFLDPDLARRFDEEMSGVFEGIGAEIGIKRNALTVISPLADTPASRAGLQPKDMILAIDGQDTAGMTVDYAVSLIRGEKGTAVNLLVAREGWEEAREMPIVRGVIRVKSVKSEVVESGGRKVGLIEVSHFNEDTEAGFSRAVRSMLLEGAEAIVLDLRNNPGGYLDTAVRLAGEWIARDVVLKEKDSRGNFREYRADGPARLDGLRTVVLVNGGSASASEIVAGALQDHGKAVILGEQTYGKGSVQEYVEYRDGSALKLTVALWYTPLERSIERDGISPDIHLENSPEDFSEDRDPQMDMALHLLAAPGWPPAPVPPPTSPSAAN